jgi:hypothetical protein
MFINIIISGVYLNLLSKYALMSPLWAHHGLQITGQLFKSNLTLCVVCVFTLKTDEWCVHNRLPNINFEDTFKRTSDIICICSLYNKICILSVYLATFPHGLSINDCRVKPALEKNIIVSPFWNRCSILIYY